MFGKKLKTETDETVSKVNKDASEELESSKNRKLTDRVKKFVMVAFLVMAGYHLYALYLGLFVSQIHNAWHLLFVTSLIFLTKRAFIYESESVIPIRDIIFAILGVIAFGYVIIEYNDLIQRAVAPNNMDIMMGLLAIALILEACRRCYGIVLPLIAIIFLLYAYFGNYIPGILHYRGATISKIIFIEYMQTSGIFGTITKTSATIILMFTMFGGFLLVSGGGSTVVNLAYALAGRFTGGPAKVAVFSSALFGSISGSAVANVVTTGQVTIPLMKSIGYRSAFAGAVEAAASTGGLIMPPIMGAGAFVMAEILGIPYTQVVKAALIPALLYYGCVLTAVHFEAKKLNLLGLPVESLPSAKKTFREGYHTIVALILLIILLVLNVPIIRTALYTIVAMILLSFFAKKEFRMYPRKIGKALINGMESLLPVAAACATASIVVGVIQLTGVALKFGTLVLGTAGDNLFLTLFFTMIILIVLGMGLPAVASYIIGASVAGPVLTELGVPVLPAHMFIFYFSNLAHITPPIALASYAAAGIAKAGPLETAKYAFFLGLTAFIVPFLFVNNNELLMMGSLPNILLAIASASIGVLSLGAGIVGFLKTRTVTFERVLLLAGGLGLMKPGIITDIFGLAVLLCVFFIQSIRQRSIKEHKEKIFN